MFEVFTDSVKMAQQMEVIINNYGFLHGLTPLTELEYGFLYLNCFQFQRMLVGEYLSV